MLTLPTTDAPCRARASSRVRRAPPPWAALRRWTAAAWPPGCCSRWRPVALAQAIELTHFEVQRSDDGVLLSFATAFELPRSVEEALLKGVPLHFEASADVMQDRWYWRDRRVAHASRGWRLTYQPLTRRFRVGFGGLNQNYDTLADALASLRSSSRWKIAEPGQLDDDSRHYVEFVLQARHHAAAAADADRHRRPAGMVAVGRAPAALQLSGGGIDGGSGSTAQA